MTSFSFLHAADLHLDTPFHGIAAESKEVRDLLVEASLKCWDSLVSLAIERRVAFVLLAGDLYDGVERGIRAQIRVRAGLERLSAVGIKTFIVHGNHDPLDGWRAAGSFPDGVTVFGHNAVQAISVSRDDEILATVYGISFDRPHVIENLSLGFRRENKEGVHIGLLHCMVGESADHGRYSPCSVDDLRAAKMDYWALGHVHQRQVLAEHSPWIVYPGNLQGRSSKPSEQGAKGVLLVQVHDGAIAAPEFIALDCVRFVRCRTDVSAIADIGDLHDAVRSEIEELRRVHEGRSLIVRVVLSGRGAVHRELARGDAPRGFLGALRDELTSHHPLVWIESVRDETRAVVDRDAIRARGDFCSELLRNVDLLSGSNGDLEALLEQEWPVSVRHELSNLGIRFERQELQAILERAESLALDLLEEEALS
jgi:DNA repair exonuclease SbcCD nuclease subunit